MNHLNIHIDSYEVDGEIVIAHIHTIINAHDRIAIVGPNGIGKSTFLKMISGEIRDYNGTIENIGNIGLGYLEQIHFLDETITVREELRNAFSEIRNIEQLLRKEEKNLEKTGEYEKYTDLLERYNLIGGYTYDGEIERISRGIGIFHLLENTLAEVSGGERTKIALAKTLLSKPDFLLLDEPTNFIDLTSVEWLENYLIDHWKGGYMIVSHDREFLDNTVTQVMEILGSKGIRITHGNYSDSVIEKQEEITRYKKAYEEQTLLIENEKTLINRFRAGSRSGFAKSREKMLERMELLEQPYERPEVFFRFESPKEKAPEVLITIQEAFIGRIDPLFFIRETEIHARERVGIVGENGVGKSTLIKTILGNLPDSESESISKDLSFIENKQNTEESSIADSSLSVDFSDSPPLLSKHKKIKVLEGYLNVSKTISIGYYSQMHETLDTTKTIEENFFLHGLPYSKERIGGILKSFLFDYHDGVRKVGNLSGGERSRLLFAILCERPYHLLILDEPTNHLDYDTREALEKALKNYYGAIVFISHDRYFVNKLSEKLWIIEDGELVISYGDYEDYRYKKEKGISLDMALFDAEGEMNLILEEKLGAREARRVREKFARKRKRQ